jgi:hypothetical protein
MVVDLCVRDNGHLEVPYRRDFHLFAALSAPNTSLMSLISCSLALSASNILCSVEPLGTCLPDSMFEMDWVETSTFLASWACVMLAKARIAFNLIVYCLCKFMQNLF